MRSIRFLGRPFLAIGSDNTGGSVVIIRIWDIQWAFEHLKVFTVRLLCWFRAFFALEGGNLVGFKDPGLWRLVVVEFGITMEIPRFRWQP